MTSKTNKATRVLTIVLVVAFVAVQGCGNGRLSVEEYAVACGEIGAETDRRMAEISFNYPELAGVVQESTDSMKRLNPPQELQTLHDLRVEALEIILSTVNEMIDEARRSENGDNGEGLSLPDMMALMEDATAKIDEKMTALESQIVVEQERLSSDTLATLQRERCVLVP